jgi:hypothetical protein
MISILSVTYMFIQLIFNASALFLFERALARASACASLHIEVLPAAGAA